MSQAWRDLVEPFRFSGRVSRPLVAVFLGINTVVLINAIAHRYGVGYDVASHHAYIKALAQGRLPGPSDTKEYFVPPLPYVVPSLVHAFVEGRFFTGYALKAAQLLNVVYSLGLTWCLVRVARIMRPADSRLPTVALLLLGMLPVYYRTMAFVRGEALVAFLALVCVIQALRFREASARPWARSIWLGVSLALLILAKQWGVFVAAPVVLFSALWDARTTGSWKRAVQTTGAAVAVTVALGGWFYVSLWMRFGTAAAFAAPAGPGLSLDRPGGLLGSTNKLFSDPVRPRDDDATFGIAPLLYADSWGDYWCYWVVYGGDSPGVSCADPSGDRVASLQEPNWAATTNRLTMGPYLGRLNLVALVPSAVFVGGLGVGLACVSRLLAGSNSDRSSDVPAILAATVGLSLAGYYVLLLRYPHLDAKASYMLHVYPLAALAGAEALARLNRVAPWTRPVVGTLLVVCLMYAVPALFTRYPQFTW